MNRVIWLKTARVYATDSDMTAKIERTTVKLEDGDNWKKFIRYAPLKGYKKDEPPVVEKVMDKKDGKWIEIDPQPWIDQLNEALVVSPIPEEKIDFKLLAEKQANELKETKANFKALEERLRILEQPKVELKQGATEMMEKVIEPLKAVEMTNEGRGVANSVHLKDDVKPIVKRTTKHK